MLDDNDSVAVVSQPVQYFEQVADIMEVQTCRGFIENVESAAGIAFREFSRELDALRLATRERRGVLAKGDIGEPDIHECLQLALDGRHRVEEGQTLLHGHVEDFVDALALVFNLEGLAVVAFALADVALHVHVRQKVHLHLDDPVAGTGLAAAALDVEAEAARRVTARPRLGCGGKEFADRGEDAGIGGRVRSWSASNRALVDVDHLVEVFETVDLLVGRGRQCGRVVEARRGDRVESVVDQRGFA